MKMRDLRGRNVKELAKRFREWVTDDTVIEQIHIVPDRGAQSMLILYEGSAIEDEDQPTLTPVMREPEDSLPVQDAEEEMICPHCNTLVVPSIVTRGPYRGRLKCSQCEKTFEKESN